jgi:SAM-dependent methyltransferase
MGRFGGEEDRSSVRLLEVGSGTGANLWFMAREGFCTHGIEGSETGVRISQERLDAECPQWRANGGRVTAGDIGRLPYRDGYFDAVLDVVAVCYSGFDAARAIYAELARATRPGGCLFSRMFARGCWGDGTGTAAGRDMWICGEGHLKGYGATRFTAEEDVPELLAGWSVERIERSMTTEGGGRHAITHLLVHGVKA